MKNYKEIKIGLIIKERLNELDISIDRILNTFSVDEKEISKMLLSESLDSNIILKWCKLLEYDFFKIYTQHIILYSPVPALVSNKTSNSQVPQFRNNLYSKDLIDFIIHKVNSGQMTKEEVIKRYGIPKTTLYRSFSKYDYKNKEYENK